MLLPLPMALFSVSDIIIAATLLLNALALISSSKAIVRTSSIAARAPGEEEVALLTSSSSSHYNDASQGCDDEADESLHKILSTSNSSHASIAAEREQEESVGGRLRALFAGIRKFSCVIVFWNLIFFTLMLTIFPHA